MLFRVKIMQLKQLINIKNSPHRFPLTKRNVMKELACGDVLFISDGDDVGEGVTNCLYIVGEGEGFESMSIGNRID